MSASETYLQPLLALLLVLGLLVILAALLRRWRPALLGIPALGRLAVIEVRPLDARTRLVLVRCDEQEHLLVIGAGSVSTLSSRGSGSG